MEFQMWSLFHYIFIISPFVVSVLLYFFTKNNSYEKNRKIGTILSIMCVVILILRNVEIYVVNGKINPELFPFQICHFANFVLLVAFWKDSKTMFITAFCFNLPAAMLSIVFANSLENYVTILNFRGFAYIAGHLLIVALTIWAYTMKFVDVRKKEVIKSAAFIFTLFILSIPINNLFNSLMPGFSSNYFYTLVPEGGTPLEMFYNFGSEISFLGMKFNPIYIILTMIIGFVVYLLMVFSISIPNLKSRLKTSSI
ncbi:MAG: hypothetical protein WC225_04840 [Acholeplasmataceae bacterium]|nr:YwaF family protein [Acholeplasmataceae bacterium]